MPLPPRVQASPVSTKGTRITKSTQRTRNLPFFVPFVIFVSLVRIVSFGADATDADLERLSAGRTIAVGAISKDGRVSNVPLEVYVARVLAGEGEPNAPEAAEEALAIAIRTFAIVNMGRHRRDGFDLCDTTHCQVPRTATAATRRAALATAGEILTFNGAPAPVYYSASCGGRSEDASVLVPGANYPYMRSAVDDVHDEDVPWTVDMSMRQLEQVLARAGFGGRLKDVRVDARDRSGRVARIALRGLEPEEVAGTQFRTAIGATLLRSTAFSIERHGDTLRFTGRGYGHGVGMCVIGAGRRARRGQSTRAILDQYYPGTRVMSLDGVTAPGASEHPAPATKIAPRAAGITQSSTVIARVPRGSSTTAGELERIGMRAHDALAKTLGVSIAPVTIELHDSLDSFRNATGQPWWISEVAAGTTIELAPAAVLEQRDGIETTVRQAMAELLVSSALANRPAWVRVGAARYFSHDSHRQPPSGKLRCPTDAELTLAISAAAQRDADSRAQACFARAIADGVDWRSVH